MVSEAVTVLVFSVNFVLGVVLGYWIRGQLAAAHEMAMAAVPKKDDKPTLHSAEEEAAFARRMDADLRARMKNLNLPVVED